MEDTLAQALVDSFPKKTPMGITGENLAAKYEITRKEADEYALLSQQRYQQGLLAKVFDKEISGIELKSKKGLELMMVDECPRASTTLESLSKLKPVFIKDTGIVTAGYSMILITLFTNNANRNASAITDGAASVILASEEAVKKYGLTPLARLVSYNYCGVEPEIMGIGPVPAIKAALKNAKLTLKDMSR